MPQAAQGGDIRRSKVTVMQSKPPPSTMLRPFSVIKVTPHATLLAAPCCANVPFSFACRKSYTCLLPAHEAS